MIPMSLLYNILDKPKGKTARTVRFSSTICAVLVLCVGGRWFVLIRTPARGVIAKRDETSRFMGSNPHLPPENHLVEWSFHHQRFPLAYPLPLKHLNFMFTCGSHLVHTQENSSTHTQQLYQKTNLVTQLKKKENKKNPHHTKKCAVRVLSQSPFAMLRMLTANVSRSINSL